MIKCKSISSSEAMKMGNQSVKSTQTKSEPFGS